VLRVPIVLSEGESEAQALPLLFETYFKKAPFILGVNFIGVGGSGSKYKPYLTQNQYPLISLYWMQW
jgi:putative ATP-dependent endonuclease of OLD family